jgi:hypothetical protein
MAMTGVVLGYATMANVCTKLGTKVIGVAQQLC